MSSSSSSAAAGQGRSSRIHTKMNVINSPDQIESMIRNGLNEGFTRFVIENSLIMMTKEDSPSKSIAESDVGRRKSTRKKSKKEDNDKNLPAQNNFHISLDHDYHSPESQKGGNSRGKRKNAKRDSSAAIVEQKRQKITGKEMNEIGNGNEFGNSNNREPGTEEIETEIVSNDFSISPSSEIIIVNDFTNQAIIDIDSSSDSVVEISSDDFQKTKAKTKKRKKAPMMKKKKPAKTKKTNNNNNNSDNHNLVTETNDGNDSDSSVVEISGECFTKTLPNRISQISVNPSIVPIYSIGNFNNLSFVLPLQQPQQLLPQPTVLLQPPILLQPPVPELPLSTPLPTPLPTLSSTPLPTSLSAPLSTPLPPLSTSSPPASPPPASPSSSSSPYPYPYSLPLTFPSSPPLQPPSRSGRIHRKLSEPIEPTYLKDRKTRIHHAGYMYDRNSFSNGTTYFRCVENRIIHCPANVAMNKEGKIFMESGEHNHETDPVLIEQSEFMLVLRRRAIEIDVERKRAQDELIRELIAEELATRSDRLRAIIDEKRLFKSLSLYRARNLRRKKREQKERLRAKVREIVALDPSFPVDPALFTEVRKVYYGNVEPSYVQFSSKYVYLVFSGYLFARNKTQSNVDTAYWRCTEYLHTRCLVRLSTEKGKIGFVAGTHNHDRDPLLIEKKKFETELKEVVRNAPLKRSIRSIVLEGLAGATEELRELYTVYNLQVKMQRARKKFLKEKSLRVQQEQEQIEDEQQIELEQQLEQVCEMNASGGSCTEQQQIEQIQQLENHEMKQQQQQQQQQKQEDEITIQEFELHQHQQIETQEIELHLAQQQQQQIEIQEIELEQQPQQQIEIGLIEQSAEPCLDHQEQTTSSTAAAAAAAAAAGSEGMLNTFEQFVSELLQAQYV